MKVQVRLFARYREAAGRDRVDLELPDGGTVERGLGGGDPPASRSSALPSVHPVRPPQRLRRRRSPAARRRRALPLPAGERRRAGGRATGSRSPPSPSRSARSPRRWSTRARAALVLFSGVVRDQTGGRRVKFLEYEAHGPMARPRCARSRRPSAARWPDITRDRPDPPHRPPRDRRVERDDRASPRPTAARPSRPAASPSTP